MSWNFMVGSLPASIGKLTMLKELELSGNDVHGPLPSSIGYMENLEKIRLDDTLISGILPAAEVSYLPKLVSFSASRDSKSGRPIFGPVPPFDKVPNLESLFLNGHDLSGPLPSSFLSASTYVRDVVLSDNAITGSLPLQMAAHTSINLELGNNRISNLPAQFCDNGKWMTGNVAALTESCDAILCRPGMASPYGRSIDAETQCEPCDGNDTTLAPYFGSTSCQSPPEPRAILAELFHACQGRQWYRNDYWMSSANVCDWYGVGCHNEEVVLINLDANNLRGRIPDSLFRLPKLQVLWLNSNRITLDFSNIGQAKNLMDLRLDSTGLRSIEGIGEAKSLTALSLSFNGLRGRFPAEDIFQLGNLRYLAMNSNSMTGLLPTSFANLRYLRTLKLDRNIFVGPIPSFDDSPSLTSLDLGSNELTGEIPHGLLAGVAIHTSSYMNINLSRNRLEGRVPESLDRFEQLNLDVTQNGLTEISPALCLKKDWNYGTVGRYGCSAILCPAQTSNEAGRQKDNLPCRSCRANDARHLGQAVCGTSASPSRKPSLWWAAGLSTALLLCLLWS
jgi:Leucine-rich repeat (LRR) protein